MVIAREGCRLKNFFFYYSILYGVDNNIQGKEK